MRLRPILALALVLLPLSAHAGYIGEDLGTDLYKRISKGHFTLKQQMIEQRLKGSAEKMNNRLGMACKKKDGTSDYCFEAGNDFTESELGSIAKGQLKAILSHFKSDVREGLTTDQILSLSNKVQEFHRDVRSEIEHSQKKLESVGTIGLYNDGNVDNSGYDIMYDIEKIHEIIFNHDIPYNGTVNMGSESIANMLAGLYDGIGDGADLQPYIPTDPILSGSGRVSIYTGVTYPEDANRWSGVLYCPPSTAGLPGNLDTAAIEDAARQQADTGKNNGPSYSLLDSGYLPEYWARLGGAGGKGLGGKGIFDKFPCSASDIFCITIRFVMYDHNVLAGGKAYTIESILDKNLEIANKYAASSLAQSKMTHGFFQCDWCQTLVLPAMLHLSTIVTSLPPPILNLDQNASGLSESERIDKEDREEILVNTFKSAKLNYKRQNSMEDDLQALAISQLKWLNTDSVPKKLEMTGPARDAYPDAKASELRNRYDASLNDDLLQLHDFSIAFTERLDMLSLLITALHEIPNK